MFLPLVDVVDVFVMSTRKGTPCWSPHTTQPHNGTTMKHPTGTIERRGDRFYVRLTRPDGSRPRKVLPAGTTEEQAKLLLEKLVERINQHGWADTLPTKPGKKPRRGGETVTAYAERWLYDRQHRRKLSSVPDDRGRLTKHVLPVIGHLGIVDVNADDLRKVVSSLDAKIGEGTLNWKTAKNVWGVVTSMFRSSMKSKNDSLRLRRDDPTRDVEPPETGMHKAKTWLYPSEWLQLANCEKVPLEWRQRYAVALYTGVRLGELSALRCEDFDLDVLKRTVARSQARPSRGGHIKATKTNKITEWSIEPEIVPLLRHLIDRAGGHGPLFEPFNIGHRARSMRLHLKQAGLTRPALFESTSERKNFRFHDTRSTTATWQALRKDSPLDIKEALAHSDLGSTQGYINNARAVGGSVGAPFPPLPRVLFSDENDAQSSTSIVHFAECGADEAKNLSKRVEAPGIEGGSTVANNTDRHEESENSSEPNAKYSPNLSRNTNSLDAFEQSIGAAIEQAARAGQWAIVSTLARDLEARRRERAGVVDLEVARAKRGAK